MGLAVDLTNPIHLKFDFDADTVTLRLDVNYSMQWQDDRLATSHCRQVLTTILSLEPVTASNSQQRGLFWAPALAMDDATEDITESTFSYADDATWLTVPPFVAAPLCEHCVTCKSCCST
jgi:hypothetical protein